MLTKVVNGDRVRVDSSAGGRISLQILGQEGSHVYHSKVVSSTPQQALAESIIAHARESIG